MNNEAVEDVEKDYDRWLLFFATLCLIISTTLILDERLLFQLKSKRRGSTVAKISNTTNDVRRRVVGDLAFFRAEDSDTLFNGDTIFTGTDSSSLISFKSGSAITLNPETMIIIESDGKENGLDVKKGSFSASINKGATLLVNIGNEKKLLNGDNAKILVSKDASGNAQIKVQKGTVLVTGPKGQVRISANEPPVLKPVQKIEKHDLDFALVSPAKDGPAWYKSSDSVNFNWKEHAGTKSYRFTVSADKDFKKVLKEETTEKTSQSVQASNLSFGVPLFWKVEDLTAHVTSPVQKFQINRDDPPGLINANKNEELKLHDLSHSSVQLQWQNWNGEKDYVIQVSKDKDFNTTLYNQTVKGTAFKLTPTSFGSYYWRVKTNNPERPHTPWSPLGVISIAQAKEYAPPKIPRTPAKVESPKVEPPRVVEPKKGGYQAFEFSD